MSEYTFKLPDLGEGTVESEIGEWYVSVGDRVAEEQVVGSMMTDKAAIEISSPIAGEVKKLAGQPGDVIAVGSPLIVFESDTDAAESGNGEDPSGGGAGTSSVNDETSPAEHAPRQKAGGKSRVMTSPAIRRRAREAGIDLTQVPGSGAGGRILRADFDAYVDRSNGERRKQVWVEAETTEQKVIGVRRIIADRMAAAKREIPHFSYVEEIDVTELETLRQHLNEHHGGNSERLTLLPLISLALIKTLREFPQCNASYDKDRNTVIHHGPVHLGIATQTADGLKVPVVRNSQRRSVDELAAEIRRVTDAARNNTIKREELTDSTITITSLGKLGGIVTTPVINMPEVAIVGINRAVERPVVVQGHVAVRLMMNLSSSFDHRFVDGFDAASMIQSLKSKLEHPATIFMD